MATNPIKMELNSININDPAIWRLSPTVKTTRTRLKWLVRQLGCAVPPSKCIVSPSAWKNPGSWFIDRKI